MWSTSDQFMFVHAQVTGDVTIVARVASVQNVDAWTKAGVMIRESLAAGARNAFALVSPGKGVAYQRRTSTGGTTATTTVSGTAPEWLKLERSGSTIRAFRSADGKQWSSLGTHTVSMASTVYVGLGVTSHDASARATARFDSVSIEKGTSGGVAAPPPGGSLPSGWSSSDIGGAPAGAASHASGVFTIDGAGRDIWGTADQFRLTYRQVSGNFDLIARVRSVERVDAWSKAGVMIRSSLSASSAHASMLVSAGKGLAFQRRATNGAASVHTSGGSQKAPRWVALTRRGSTITAFHSADGASWTEVGSQQLTLPATFYVGLAVTSHSTSPSLATAVFDNVTLRMVSGATNAPPSVSLTAPAAGASFTAPASITVSANASDSDGSITQVEFYVGSTKIGSADTSAPYSTSWNNVPAGTYLLTAVARDSGGATTVSSARSVTVRSVMMPTTAVFSPSSNHSTAVTRYIVEFFYAGSNPAVSNPVATDDIGKPSVVNGEIHADVSQTITTLTPGSYIATVTAVGSGGSARSAPSPAFTR